MIATDHCDRAENRDYCVDAYRCHRCDANSVGDDGGAGDPADDGIASDQRRALDVRRP